MPRRLGDCKHRQGGPAGRLPGALGPALCLVLCMPVTAKPLDPPLASQPLPAAAAPASVVTVMSTVVTVGVTVGPNGTFLSNLQVAQALVSPAMPKTTNLLFQGAAPDPGMISGTALGTAGSTVAGSRGGVVRQHDPACCLVVSGIAVGTLATEEWRINVTGAAVQWDITRTYHAAGTATFSKFPALTFQTTNGAYANPAPHPHPHPHPPSQPAGGVTPPSEWERRVQIPSFTSLEPLLNSSSGGAAPSLAYTMQTGWRALLGEATRNDSRRLLLSPSGIELRTHMPRCRFSFARPPTVVTQQIGVGAECAGYPGDAYPFRAGDAESNTLMLTFAGAEHGHGRFLLSGMADAQLEADARTFARVYNMFMGWVYGNSPACETCWHEVSLFPQLQRMYSVAPPVEGVTTVHDAMRKSLDLLFAQSTNSSGYVWSRWNILQGNLNHVITGQIPHSIVAAHEFAMNTGDQEAVRRWLPKARLVMGFMLDTMLLNTTSGRHVLTNTLSCDGLANESCADNWLDDIRFGWEDAIVAAYGVRAVRCYAELLAWLGLGATPEAKAMADLYPVVLAAYNTAFWDDAAGMYHDWIDREGHRRSYFYVWQNYVAVEFGIASPARAKTIMATAERLFAGIRAQYNVSSDQLFCTPTNLLPCRPEDITLDFDDEYVFGHYENGACFFLMSGLEQLALGRAVTPDAAYARFAAAAPHFRRTRFWGQRYGWMEETPLGDDVITDSMLFLHGFLFGAFNVRPTLLHGLETLGPPAAALHGASFTFAYLGKDVTVTARGNTTLIHGL